MRSRVLALVAAVAMALFLALGLEPAHADGGAPSPPDGVCLGNIHYTFSPPLQLTPRPTTITWSGTYSCTSVTRAWNGEFGGSVQSTTGCLQTGANQILAQGLTENDNWFASGGDDRIGSSALTGTVSTLPREDGSRLYEWTGTVTGGTWFRGHRFNGNGLYSSVTNGKVCAAGGAIDHNDGEANITILPL
ncbi:hypothetical protein [Streptomyces gilvosporeus]|uniref:Uncharacterized protein n=1 Tax=Streptomyces gilvosporeus TaxID=553510 RepID=A0A1V0U0B5_9ACTN|nr:hypothetical protein [Streptomyces gilvosporeus]ARF58654.1 hypothetical protein B1H19_34710 [Streptomyces gilvosporeus]